MPNEVQMSIKMDRALREAFLEAATKAHRPAAQIVREFMREFVSEAQGDTPQQDRDDDIRAANILENTNPAQWRSLDDLRRTVRG